MATIKFSTRIAENIAGTTGITSSSAGTPALAAYSTYNGYLRILSGPIPTQNELENAYPTWDRFTGSPSEVLIERAHTAAQFGSVTSGGVTYVTWDLELVTAVRSGVASWWCWSGYEHYDPVDRGAAPGAPDNYYVAALIGDITAIAGGGSMTLVDLNIVAGQTYELGPARFVLPREYTY